MEEKKKGRMGERKNGRKQGGMKERNKGRGKGKKNVKGK